MVGAARAQRPARPRWALGLACAAALVLAGCAAPSALPVAPESASGFMPKPGWSARRHMVAAAHPLAVQAGVDALRDGGTALDAAVAVQLVLGVVEPQSSGIGGGAFLLHWDGREVQAWDGRETAPAGAGEGLFLGDDGKPLPFLRAVASSRAVGVPGTLRLLAQAHDRHGRLPWARLVTPALDLAAQGFAVSPRLHAALRDDPLLRDNPAARSFFYSADGSPWPVGHRLLNPALAALLTRIASEGAEAFYRDRIGADLVRRVTSHPARAGAMTMADLAAYAPVQREALCNDWTARWRICGFPPPSSGHLAVMQILGMVGAGAALEDGVPGADWLHRYVEASRLAFTDRAAYVGDPAFVDAPAGDWQTLLAPAYLAQRAALIGPRRRPQVEAGRPGGHALAAAPMAEQVESGTSHLSIVDGEGGAVSMTTTVESAFGSRILADGGTGLPGGYFLNNELTDFAFVPRDAQGRQVANRVQPGKRPRSSMSPTLVFDRADGRLRMSLGSAGGSAIIHHTAKTLLGSLAWGLDAQRAIDLPNFGSAGGPVQLEPGRFPAATLAALRGRGHEVRESVVTSGTQAIERRQGGWFGGADPRRDGVAAGE